MIKVSISPECLKIMEYIEIPTSRINQTFNDRHRGILIKGNPMTMGSVHWFDDGQIVFATASVTKTSRVDNKTKFDEVECKIALELDSELPAGSINKDMRFEQILDIVAESFGVPFKCSTHGKFSNLQRDEYFDGNIQFMGGKKDSNIFIQIHGNMNEQKCWHSWAFSIDRYKDWYERKLTAES